MIGFLPIKEGDIWGILCRISEVFYHRMHKTATSILQALQKGTILHCVAVKGSVILLKRSITSSRLITSINYFTSFNQLLPISRSSWNEAETHCNKKIETFWIRVDPLNFFPFPCQKWTHILFYFNFFQKFCIVEYHKDT